MFAARISRSLRLLFPIEERFGELEQLRACLSVAADQLLHASITKSPSLFPVILVSTQWRPVGKNLEVFPFIWDSRQF